MGLTNYSRMQRYRVIFSFERDFADDEHARAAARAITNTLNALTPEMHAAASSAQVLRIDLNASVDVTERAPEPPRHTHTNPVVIEAVRRTLQER